MQSGPARAISNWVPAPWADPSLNATNGKATLRVLRARSVRVLSAGLLWKNLIY